MAKRLLVPAFVLAVVYVGGGYGFNYWEGWGYFDSAFYITMAVTSVAAYGGMIPQTYYGKLLLMVISVIGVANMLYIFAILADLMSRHDDRNREILKSLLVQKAKGDSL